MMLGNTQWGYEKKMTLGITQWGYEKNNDITQYAMGI